MELPKNKDYSLRGISDIDLSQFDCADKDLNIFFRENAKDNEEELVSKTYFLTKSDDKFPLVAFCVSNAEIRTNSDFDMVISPQSQYETYPAVRIGRFATHKDHKKKGLGHLAMNLIKTWFITSNKTGCRFIIVDARKTEEAQKFYNTNGFEDYPEQNNKEKTILKYFDLKTLEIAIKSFPV